MMPVEPITLKHGIHAGESITRVPVSYLRWMMSVGHREAEAAREELDRRGTFIPSCDVSGHAIDRASLKCLKRWEEFRLSEEEGLHAWLCRSFLDAIRDGEEIEPGKFVHRGMCFVRGGSAADFPALKTCWPVSREKLKTPAG